MGTPYIAIYKRAITELKDPDIKALFNNNDILFGQVMYNFLENAITLFTNPMKVVKRLQDRNDPYLISDTFVGDGHTVDFILTETPKSQEDLEYMEYRYTIGDLTVNGTYDYNTNTVTLDTAPEMGSKVILSLYYTGVFKLSLFDQEVYILSQLLLSCWSEYINNDKLDIIRLLGDTDFKLTSNSSTTTSKVNWNIVNRETAVARMNKFAWDSILLRLY